MSTAAETRWTTANTAEAMPGVQTPLDWTFWGDPLELAMCGGFCDMGVLRPSEVRLSELSDHRYTGIFHGRVAGNVNKLREIGDLMPGTSGDAVEQQVFGNVASGIQSRSSIRRVPAVAVKMPILIIRVRRLIEEMREDYTSWWRLMTAPEVLTDYPGAPDRLAAARQRFHDMMRPHVSATMLAQAAYEQVESLAESAGLAGLETTLITGYGGMEEAEIAAELWDVSRERSTLERFVAEHGYHGPHEGAPSSRSWREDDSPLRALVTTYRTMDDDEAPRAVMDQRREARVLAEAELLAATPRLARARTRMVLKFAERQIPLREVGKAAFLQAIDVGRAAARSRGAELAENGALDDPDDVFFLTFDEVTGEFPPDAAELVATRRVARERYLTTKLPEGVWSGEPEMVKIETPTGDRPDAITGIPVSPGAVEGRARVVDDPNVGIAIEPGEILVCETTDPSWASYFLVASALVIDIGGAVSHGAIVARELGIPCVINTRIGTAAISTGDLLSVDGASGEIRVLERAPAPDAAEG